MSDKNSLSKAAGKKRRQSAADPPVACRTVKHADFSREAGGIAAALATYDDFLIATHVYADGDAIGAVLLCAAILRKLGKRSQIVLHDAAPDLRYRFLPGFSEIHSFEQTPDPGPIRALLALDVPTMARIGDVAQLLPDGIPVLVVDHHASNEAFGQENFVRPEASSTCELLHEVVTELGLPFDEPMATCLYTGIAFDTGGFRFSNTSGEALRIAAEMVDRGVRPDRIADALFHRRSYEATRHLGRVLSGIELHLSEKVSSIYLPGDRSKDTDGFINYALFIDGVEVAFFIRDEEPGHFRVSLRSQNEVDVNLIAGRFGGGGHRKAAGCRMAGRVEEVKRLILEEIARHLRASCASENG
ncbi:MAG: bifunctional oligoribonuclease/PAP phosphatase NrnA [Candidatus Latescibacterota bacterium]